jgi:hypothetical protein
VASPAPALEPVTLEGSFVRLEPMTTEHHSALTAIGLHPDIWLRVIDDEWPQVKARLKTFITQRPTQ